MLSISPQWVALILNGAIQHLGRMKFPKDYVGWVYIYCTKGKLYLYKDYDTELTNNKVFVSFDKPLLGEEQYLGGKVVGRFWCRRVEPYKEKERVHFYNLRFGQREIFDKPRNLNSFYKPGSSEHKDEYDSNKFRDLFAIKKAPANYKCQQPIC